MVTIITMMCDNVGGVADGVDDAVDAHFAFDAYEVEVIMRMLLVL